MSAPAFRFDTAGFDRRGSELNSWRKNAGFTLVELLVVVAIISILLVLLVPALSPLKSAKDVTSAAYTINGALEQGRAYAMANNTYVWVGFYEEDASATTPTNTAPAYSGHGRVVIGTIASQDGTAIFDASDPAAPLPPARTTSVGKLIHIEGIHVTDIGQPPGGGNPESLDGRPATPYTDGGTFASDHFNRISSESADTTRFPFSTQSYTFYKTVRFSPAGEANLNSTYSLKRAAEIGLRPTHGSVIDTNTRNVVAIQFSGIGGNFKIYRR